MSNSSDEQALQQTEAIWKFLDAMSLNNPKEYEQFIQKVLKDGESNNLGPPRPVFVVETEKIPEVIPIRKYFINFSEWVQLPKPENDSSPVTMATSEIRKELIDKEWSHIIDVTMNPIVFPSNDSLHHIEKCALVELVFRHIESKFSLKISRKFKLVEGSTYIGNQDNLLNFMCPSAMRDKLADGVNKGITLEQIKSLAENNQPTVANNKMNLHGNGSNSSSSKMIDTSSSSIITSCNGVTNSLTEVKTSSSKQKTTSLPTPKVEMLVCKDKNVIELTIYLPKVESVCECDLEITESSLSLHVEKKYELELSFPVDVDTESSSAKFVKDQKILLITAIPEVGNAIR